MESIYRRSRRMVARTIGEEVILVPARKKGGDAHCIYSLNGLATFIWGRIDGQRTVGQLVESVCQEFSADRAEVQADLLDFITHLARIGAVDLREPADRAGLVVIPRSSETD